MIKCAFLFHSSSHQFLLLGCDEGLYVMNLERMSDPVAQLLGVGSIYQMKYIPQLVSVIIIAGRFTFLIVKYY